MTVIGHGNGELGLELVANGFALRPASISGVLRCSWGR
jgi:hypothetical protein